MILAFLLASATPFDFPQDPDAILQRYRSPPAPAAPTDAAADEARRTSEVAHDVYYLCVRDKAREFARGRESAEAIAEAVISACGTEEIVAHSAEIKYFAAHHVSEVIAEQQWADKLLPDMHAAARREAMRWVVEARLPAPKKKSQ